MIEFDLKCERAEEYIKILKEILSACFKKIPHEQMWVQLEEILSFYWKTYKYPLQL